MRRHRRSRRRASLTERARCYPAWTHCTTTVSGGVIARFFRLIIWWEVPFLQLRVINELSPGGTAIVPRPHYDAHGASAECTDLFELAVYRPGTALESGLIAHHRAALLSDVSEEERSPGKLQELDLEMERGDTWHRTPGKMETK